MTFFHVLVDVNTLASKYLFGLEVIKLEFILKLRIKRNGWLLADACPQAVNHCALFLV